MPSLGRWCFIFVHFFPERHICLGTECFLLSEAKTRASLGETPLFCALWVWKKSPFTILRPQRRVRVVFLSGCRLCAWEATGATSICGSTGCLDQVHLDQDLEAWGESDSEVDLWSWERSYVWLHLGFVGGQLWEHLCSLTR